MRSARSIYKNNEIVPILYFNVEPEQFKKYMGT